MKVTTLLYGIAAATGLVSGQSTNTKWVEPNTGIEFAVARFDSTSAPPGGFTWGYVLPPAALTSPGTEYLGLLIGTHTGGKAYSGISHYSSMPNGLLLVAWPNGADILTSFRWASGWVVPEIYTGNATLTQIYHNVNSTHFTLVYRCQNCWAWNQNGASQSNPTNTDYQGLAWAQALTAPDPQNDPNGQVLQHERQGNFAGQPSSAAHSSYSVWASKATAVPVTTTKTTSTATPTATISSAPVPTGTWDYIVVGGGAGGITVADKLSEAGKKVLLVEIGPASLGRTGGVLGPAWPKPQNLTRFDVPGLDNEIWVDSNGIACTGIDQMAGCVLGGGTSVNAGLWWKPPALDWNVNFPAGWKSTDMAPATQRVFSRIPGTDHPSMDGIVYLPQGYNLIGGALAKAGWANVTANNVPDQKNHTFTRGPFMYRGGQRDGPSVTYLTTAKARSNFKLLLNTAVRRVIRTNGHITGVELQAFKSGGSTGIVNVTATTGRVILSAGTFGSAKILFRSGIGPTDQLNIVKGSAIDGASMIPSAQWINLPVGYNLDDHCNTDLVIRHPSLVFYDFYEAYNTPIEADKNLYLNKRSGILAQSAPNIGPLFHESIYGADGATRQLQWTARVEGSLGEDNNNTMTLSQYLGRGAKSRGRTTINGALGMEVAQAGWPYLHDKNDVEAVITGIDNLLKILKTIPNITILHPAAGQTTRDYVNAYDLSPASRRANHWIGSAKLGTDDGRQNGGTAVVDVNTKVYGTDNLFVVDASIFPGMVTTNPSAPIMIAAERAAERILALKTTTASAKYAQCSGQTFDGSNVCDTGLACTYVDAYYSQCL